MARALLIGLLLVVSPVRAYAATPGTELAEQVIGIQPRLGVGALVGEGAGDVDQPPISHVSASVHIRVIPEWYVELTTFGERTLRAEAPEGKTILGMEGATAGIRWRPAIGAGTVTRIVVGAGGGGGRVFVQGKGVPGEGASWRATEAYALAGFEREVSQEGTSAGYVGVELVGQQYFASEESVFNGASITARVTFSWYMGSGYFSECL